MQVPRAVQSVKEDLQDGKTLPSEDTLRVIYDLERTISYKGYDLTLARGDVQKLEKELEIKDAEIAKLKAEIEEKNKQQQQPLYPSPRAQPGGKDEEIARLRKENDDARKRIGDMKKRCRERKEKEVMDRREREKKEKEQKEKEEREKKEKAEKEAEPDIKYEGSPRSKPTSRNIGELAPAFRRENLNEQEDYWSVRVEANLWDVETSILNEDFHGARVLAEIAYDMLNQKSLNHDTILSGRVFVWQGLAAWFDNECHAAARHFTAALHSGIDLDSNTAEGRYSHDWLDLAENSEGPASKEDLERFRVQNILRSLSLEFNPAKKVKTLKRREKNEMPKSKALGAMKTE